MAFTNKSLNTGSITNKERGSASMTFGDTTPDTFAEGVGTFGNPYTFDNKSVNTASISNKAQS